MMRCLIAFFFLLAAQEATLGLAAATAPFAPGHGSVPEVDGPIVLPLSRKVVEFGHQGNATNAATRSFFIGNLLIGDIEHPQELQVSFETGSGLVVLDSTRCNSPACLKHRRYAPSAAEGAVDVMADGTPAAAAELGDMATIGIDTSDLEPGRVTGDFVRDRVCLGAERTKGGPAHACATVALLAATNMSQTPFSDLPFDGIVGLGMEGLSVSEAFNFNGRLLKSSPKVEPRFALFVPPAWASGEAGGRAEITFGGLNEARLASPLTWVPVERPEEGYWQVRIQAVRIGGKPAELCAQGCLGILDSGSSRLAVPAEALPSIEEALAVTTPYGSFLGVGDCSTAEGQDLEIVLDDHTTLTLAVKDYVAREGARCAPLLHPWTEAERKAAGQRSDMGKTVRAGGFSFGTIGLGEPILRKYYTAYDWREKKVGFGLAAKPQEPEEPNLAEGHEEFILMQQCRSDTCIRK